MITNISQLKDGKSNIPAVLSPSQIMNHNSPQSMNRQTLTLFSKSLNELDNESEVSYEDDDQRNKKRVLINVY